jgi:(p)ppGpp synthase/HD superfamily hydrolase
MHRAIYPSSELAIAAYTVALACHMGQTRRDGVTPYMVHIDAVMSRASLDPVMQAVAACHDVHEQDAAHYASVEDLRELFATAPEDDAADVIDGIVTLTRRQGETYEAYILRIKEHRDGLWVPIKVADLLSNLADQPSLGQIKRYAAALLTLLS